MICKVLASVLLDVIDSEEEIGIEDEIEMDNLISEASLIVKRKKDIISQISEEEVEKMIIKNERDSLKEYISFYALQFFTDKELMSDIFHIIQMRRENKQGEMFKLN